MDKAFSKGFVLYNQIENGKLLSKDAIFENSFEDHGFQIQFFQKEFITPSEMKELVLESGFTRKPEDMVEV